MTKKFTLPSASTLMMLVIIIAALLTWILPAGQYSKLTNENNQAFVALRRIFLRRGDLRVPLAQTKKQNPMPYPQEINAKLKPWIDTELNKTVVDLFAGSDLEIKLQIHFNKKVLSSSF